ncbi:MAG: hypothetical protein CMJ48_08695 [Planctomycetaceae bacterium]|nr:hypothetical protein [Planctomycetaceae bacterium]
MSFDQPLIKQVASDRSDVQPASLFSSHANAVFAVCLANTRNHHDAEDIVQAVFLKATARISSLREPARARAWLLQVARRECVDFHRRRRPTEPLLDEPPTPSPDGDVLGGRLHEAVRLLPQSYREVIMLYYMDGRDCPNVASSLSVTEAAVRQRLVRARARLHDLLREVRT